MSSNTNELTQINSILAKFENLKTIDTEGFLDLCSEINTEQANLNSIYKWPESCRMSHSTQIGGHVTRNYTRPMISSDNNTKNSFPKHIKPSTSREGSKVYYDIGLKLTLLYYKIKFRQKYKDNDLISTLFTDVNTMICLWGNDPINNITEKKVSMLAINLLCDLASPEVVNPQDLIEQYKVQSEEIKVNAETHAKIHTSQENFGRTVILIVLGSVAASLFFPVAALIDPLIFKSINNQLAYCFL